MPHLRKLWMGNRGCNVENCEVTDIGIGDILTSPALTELYLSKCLY